MPKSTRKNRQYNPNKTTSPYRFTMGFKSVPFNYLLCIFIYNSSFFGHFFFQYIFLLLNGIFEDFSFLIVIKAFKCVPSYRKKCRFLDALLNMLPYLHVTISDERIFLDKIIIIIYEIMKPKRR